MKAKTSKRGYAVSLPTVFIMQRVMNSRSERDK